MTKNLIKNTTIAPILTCDQLFSSGITPVSIKIFPHDRIGISGHSGSGKSRLLRLICDLDPHQGEMLLNGKNYRNIEANLWRQQIALLPATSQWWHEEILNHFSTPPDKQLLDQLNLTNDILSNPIHRLSSGEKQRLAILRLISQQPSLLLLDEPTANLDKDNVTAVENLLVHYCKTNHAALIIVSHDQTQLQRLCQQIYQMNQGTLTVTEK